MRWWPFRHIGPVPIPEPESTIQYLWRTQGFRAVHRACSNYPEYIDEAMNDPRITLHDYRALAALRTERG